MNPIEKISFFKIVRVPVILLLSGLGAIFLSYYQSLPSYWENGPLFLNSAGIILCMVAVALTIYNLLYFLLKFYEHKYIHNRLGYSLLKTLRKALPIIFTLILLEIVIGFVTLPFFYVHLFHSILSIALILAIGWTLVQFLSALEFSAYQYTLNHPGEYQIRAQEFYTKIHIIKNIGNILIIVLMIAAILMTFNSVKNIGISILASAGVITALVGLAAQKTTSSMFASLQLALNQVIKIGDYVVVKDFNGVVEEITFTYVALSAGKHRIILPISTFLDQPFENWSKNGNLVGSLKLELTDDIPLDPVRSEIDHILNQSKSWDKNTKSVVLSDWRWKDKTRFIELTIVISAETPAKLDDLKNEIREKLLHFTNNQLANKASTNSSA